jgi:hypothetical protein
MHASSGSPIDVTGELTGPDRADAPVVVHLHSPSGAPLAEASGRTDAEGSFRLRVQLPAGLEPGHRTLEAQAKDLRGHARVEIL